MTLATSEHPTPVLLLADAVHLVQTVARFEPHSVEPVARACLRALVHDLLASAHGLDAALGPSAPPPAPARSSAAGPPAVQPLPEAGDCRAERPGSLRVSGTGDEVRLQGRGPAGEGDLVRAALHRRAGASGTEAEERLGGLLWTALVTLSRDGLEPPTALPTPLTLVGRFRAGHPG